MIEPDAYPDDPYGWATNQAGHAMIGLAGAVVAGLLGLSWLVVPPLYWLVAELGLQRGRLWRDGLVDTAHVGAGAGIAAAICAGSGVALAALAIWAAMLAHGAWRRI